MPQMLEWTERNNHSRIFTPAYRQSYIEKKNILSIYLHWIDMYTLQNTVQTWENKDRITNNSNHINLQNLLTRQFWSKKEDNNIQSFYNLT